MQGIDFDILDAVFLAIGFALDAFIYATIDISNSGSIIMIFWNMLPVVGNNPLPNETWLIIMASFGAIVGYYRWFD